MPSGISPRNQRAGKTLAERLAFYSRRAPNGCLLWVGARRRNGRGVVTVPGEGRQMEAHRASWVVANGPIPPGIDICHHCDVRHCIEPTHLFAGTRAENLADMCSKGRQARGEIHGQAKLTAAQVLAIRGDTRHPKIVAAEYDISRQYVIKLRQGEKWAHLRLATLAEPEVRSHP